VGHPVFFSFANDSKVLAERVAARFSDDLVYMYARSGVDGVNFPEEILAEIAQCQIFVIFWSSSYVSGDPRRPWCRRELLTALTRYKNGTLTNFVIVQVDQTALDKTIEDPDTGLPVDALGPLREKFRAFTPPIDAKSLEIALGRELAKVPDLVLPELARPELLQQLRLTLDVGSLQTKTPLVIVSGFPGSGRSTLVRTLMNADYRHLNGHTIPLDSADGPEDFLQLIWGEVLQKTIKEQRSFLNAAKRNPTLLRNYFQQLSGDLVKRRKYVLIAKEELTDLSEVLPHWFVEFFALVKPAVQPLFFVLVPRTLPAGYRKFFEFAAEVHVPTLEDVESERLVNMHIAARDPNRVGRWADHISEIVRIGSNSPKLLVDVVRLAARRPSLEFLTQDAESAVARFDERVTQLVNWAWLQVRDQKHLVLVLDVLNTLTVAHYEALEDIFKDKDFAIGDALYELVQCGLVEHLNESTFRVPPAFRRKLNFYLVNPQIRIETDQLLKRFGKTINVGEDEFGGVALSNVLHVKLAMDVPLAEADLAFVTAGMLFKSGWQQYRKARTTAALGLFKRAFAMVETVRDESTKVEIARFYGLAAAREGALGEMQLATQYLAHPKNFSPRVSERAKSYAPFIRGFSHRLNQEAVEARDEYEDALQMLPEGGFTDQQRSVILNELVQCILKIQPVDYDRAVALAERSRALRGTTNSLDILLRALLAQTFDDPHLTREKFAENIAAIDRWEAELKLKCQQGNMSFYYARVAERNEREEYARVREGSLAFGVLNLANAIRTCEEGYLETGEHVLLTKKWDYMLRTEVGRNWKSLHEEASAFLQDSSHGRLTRGVASRIRILTFDLSDPRQAAEANAELSKGRASGLIPKAAAQDIRKKIELGAKLASSRLTGPLIE
jgi:hypothetical protein